MKIALIWPGYKICLKDAFVLKDELRTVIRYAPFAAYGGTRGNCTRVQFYCTLVHHP